MLNQNEIAVISISEYSKILNKLEQAWQHFMDGNTCPHLPRYPILESWQRSKEKRVPYNLIKAPLALNDIQISEEKDRLQVLFETMDPFIKDIVDADPYNSIAVTFSNDRGVILDCRCSDKLLLDKFREDNYIPGADWSETAFGTNGISVTLERGKPTQVFAVEHYCEIAHGMICSSAPIKETLSGVILGVLTITSQRHIIPALNLNWVISEARKIERALLGQMQKDSATLFNLLFENSDKPAIIYDLKGRVCKVNKSAQTRFNAKTGDKLEQIFNYSTKQSPFLHNFSQSFLTTYRSAGRRYIATVMPWAIGKYIIGGIAFFQQECPSRSGVKQTKRNEFSSSPRYYFSSLIGQNKTFQKTINLAEKSSIVESSVLIIGETGTGKEILAQSIHNNSQRKEQTFLSVNCGALPKELIATELFGYEEGAFTGAQKGGRIGKFEAAHRGTLFLDEIGDMPLELQVYLLRVLEEGTITRIGSHKTIPVDVRIICATNKDLLREVELGRFRRDLYYRINSIEIFIPPLRERREDIPLLAKHFLQGFGDGYLLSSDAIKKLTGYPWPGNVRELKNVIGRAVILKDGFSITANDLPLPEPKLEIANCRYKTAKLKAPKNLEPDLIKQVLQECSGNVSLAARQLQISRMTLYRKIKKYKITY